MSNNIRQLEERLVASEITLLRWSDRMDLLALANAKAEVSLHRLTWQRVWCLAPHKNDTNVSEMAWRPDGKILAIAYNLTQSRIRLIEVENKNILRTIVVGGLTTCMSWQLSKMPAAEKESELYDLNDSSKFLTDLPALSSEFTSLSKNALHILMNINFIKEQTDLNVLIIGTKTGFLQVLVFGLFSVIAQNFKTYCMRDCEIISARFSDNLGSLYVTVRHPVNEMEMYVIDTSVFNTHSSELFTVAMKHGHIISLLSYINNTMSSITEAWESILLEMDSKLSRYASNVPEGTVSADFLDLLMFGIPSDEMEEFLMQDLTDKGLKKLGHSIELSYSNIQKLLLKHLTKIGQNITYHLAELRGMARFTPRYKKLGLDEKTITSAMMANGAFLVKSAEVQQVINYSMTNYKAFFRWLYVVILRLMDEQIPPEIPKMAQQDMAYITEFLQNFDQFGKPQEGTRSRFNLERLGQYLVNEPLKILPINDNNIWQNFLDENECVADHDSIIKHFKTMSLVEQHNHLIEAVNQVFEVSKEAITNSLTRCFKGYLKLAILPNEDSVVYTVSSISESISCFAFVHKDSECGCKFVELIHEASVSMNAAFLYACQLPDMYSDGFVIADVKFYSSLYLSVLVNDPLANVSYICQVPVAGIRERLKHVTIEVSGCLLDDCLKIDVGDIPGLITKKLEGITASQFAVSGTRHVSVVLSDNKRKVQLFEMEADEEEEDETEMTFNLTKDSDAMKSDEMNTE